MYIQSLGSENGGVLYMLKDDITGALLLVKAHNASNTKELYTVAAHVNNVVKGGLIATVNGLRGFIPTAYIESHFVKDLSDYIGQTLEVVPIEIDSHKRRIILSRRPLYKNCRRELDPVASKNCGKRQPKFLRA